MLTPPPALDANLPSITIAGTDRMPSCSARARLRASFMLRTMTSDEEPASRLTTSITSSQSAHPALNTSILRLSAIFNAPSILLQGQVQEPNPMSAFGKSGHFTTEFQCPLLGVKRTLAGCASMSANRRLSSNLHLISSAEVRHRYGRAFISAPKPTIPSMINTSSPITIQPCNAVMFSSLRIDDAENWREELEEAP